MNRAGILGQSGRTSVQPVISAGTYIRVSTYIEPFLFFSKWGIGKRAGKFTGERGVGNVVTACAAESGERRDVWSWVEDKGVGAKEIIAVSQPSAESAPFQSLVSLGSGKIVYVHRLNAFCVLAPSPPRARTGGRAGGKRAHTQVW